jgi:hypothetical protein
VAQVRKVSVLGVDYTPASNEPLKAEFCSREKAMSLVGVCDEEFPEVELSIVVDGFSERNGWIFPTVHTMVL